MSLLRYSLLLLLLALLLEGVAYLVVAARWPGALDAVLLGVGLEAGITLLAYWVVKRGLHSRAGVFAQAVQGSSLLKLLLTLGCMATAAVLNRAGMIPIVLAYFLAYLVFSGFEVVVLLANLRHNSKR